MRKLVLILKRNNEDPFSLENLISAFFNIEDTEKNVFSLHDGVLTMIVYFEDELDSDMISAIAEIDFSPSDVLFYGDESQDPYSTVIERKVHNKVDSSDSSLYEVENHSEDAEYYIFTPEDVEQIREAITPEDRAALICDRILSTIHLMVYEYYFQSASFLDGLKKVLIESARKYTGNELHGSANDIVTECIGKTFKANYAVTARAILFKAVKNYASDNDINTDSSVKVMPRFLSDLRRLLA